MFFFLLVIYLLLIHILHLKSNSHFAASTLNLYIYCSLSYLFCSFYHVFADSLLLELLFLCIINSASLYANAYIYKIAVFGIIITNLSLTHEIFSK